MSLMLINCDQGWQYGTVCSNFEHNVLQKFTVPYQRNVTTTNFASLPYLRTFHRMVRSHRTVIERYGT